jgi:hypothetical protein
VTLLYASNHFWLDAEDSGLCHIGIDGFVAEIAGAVRSDPGRLTADPYGAGWLFEGWEVPGRTRAGLISGPQAAAWQAQERERVTNEIHETHAPGCDGGAPVRGVAQFLSRPDLVRLFQHFFSRTDWGMGA